MVRLTVIAFIALFTLFLLTIYMNAHENSFTREKKLIITVGGFPTSFDPLEADQAQNLLAARMIYTTPIEITAEGTLTSSILKYFEYEKQTRRLTLIVRGDRKFSDGSQINPEDVLMAILRMAYERPKFPVIANIAGVKIWRESASPLTSLPSGIQLAGDKITIQFDNEVKHPLFRFALELFSIIPGRCIDKKTNKILCENIPSSGFYSIVEKNTTDILFERRHLFDDNKMPLKLRFKYESPDVVSKSDYIDNMSSDSIIYGNETAYQQSFFSSKKMDVIYAPGARFSGFVINNKYSFFKNKHCRQRFASLFRKIFHSQPAVQGLNEASIFTEILPGYVPQNEFEAISQTSCKIANVESEKIDIALADVYKKDPESPQVAAIRDAFLKMGIKKENITFSFEKGMGADLKFSKNESPLVFVGSGFWALDPAGDLQMLFTPNLHKPLEQLSSDQALQEMISKIVENESPDDFIKLNHYIYENALFNIFAHMRRFYMAKERNILNPLPPFSITMPAPWQLFKME